MKKRHVSSLLGATLLLVLLPSGTVWAGESESSLERQVGAGMHEGKDQATKFNNALPADGQAHNYNADVSAKRVMEHANVAPVDPEMFWNYPTRYEEVTHAPFTGTITLEEAKDGGYYSKFWGKMKAGGGGGGGPGDLTWDFFGEMNTFQIVKVEWKEISSPLDANPNANGGLRIFPGKQNPTDTKARNTVEVVATIEPKQANVTVYFKAFDVDDPSTDEEPVDDTRNGNDNRDDPKSGVLSAFSAVTDAEGEARVVFTVGMKPGDNYRVAASLNQDELNTLAVRYTITGPYVTPDSAEIIGFSGKTAPMLTVWRKLHYEIDKMSRPTYDQNTVYGYWDNLTAMGAGRYGVDLSHMAVRSSSNFYEGDTDEYLWGYIELRLANTTSRTHGQVIKYIDNWFPLDNYAEVYIKSPPSTISSWTEGWFDISDDDTTESVFVAKAHGSIEVTPPDTSLMLPAYSEAYILPVNKDEWNDSDISFERNTPSAPDLPIGLGGYTKMGEKKSIEGAPGFKKVTLAYLFQAGQGEDLDPPAEGGTTGYSPYTNYTTDDLRCAVFWASIADPDLSQPNQKGKIFIAHEICHALIGAGHTSSGIMVEMPGNDDIRFALASLDELRNDF